MPTTEKPTEPPKEAIQKPTGKWAAEAFDFLRLFSKVGGSFTGLVLLEIGWAIVLGLVRNLSGNAAIPILGVPWRAADGWSIHDIRLTSIYWIGALLVALAWSLTSGFYLYLWRPVFKVLRFVLSLFVQVLFFPVVILTLLLSIPLLAIGAIKKNRWIRKQPADAQAKLAKLKQDDIGEYRGTIAQETGFDPWWLADGVVSVYDFTLEALGLTGQIGLAPIYGYTFEEDLNAAKVPSQMFASAASRLRTRFDYLPSVKRAAFLTLPALLKVTNARRARWARKWLDLETVLWGSYLSTDPPRIWLNVERPPAKQEREKGEPSISERLDPFHSGIDEWDPEMLVVDQNDLLDAYIALVITLVQALKVRRPRIPYLLKALREANEQKIRIANYPTKKTLDHYLVTEVLAMVDTPPSTDVLYPTVKSLLVDLAGRWLARQLNPIFLDDSDKSPDFFKPLLPMALKCVELEPDRVDHHYRLAALQLVLDETEKALDTLAEAQSKHHFLYESDRFYLEAIASSNYDLLESRGNRKLKLSIAIVCTAKAIAAGGDQAKQSLRKDFEETKYYRLYGPVLDVASEVSQVHGLLYKMLGLTESTRETQGGRSRAAARIRPSSRRQGQSDRTK